MYCINPILIEGRGIFPCGICRFCRKVRQNQFSMRMMHEAKYHKDTVFVTLTYKDECLTEPIELSKKDLQDFLKRFRKRVEPRKIKYFACGEYGEKLGRPHYHLIMFSVGISDELLIEKSWSKGFIKVEEANETTFRYVCKYLTKALLGRARKESNGLERTQPFQLLSKGIGLSWIMDQPASLSEVGLQNRGRKVSMPRYYCDKLRERGLSVSVVEDAKADRVQKDRAFRDRLIAKGLTDDEISRRMEGIKQRRIEEARSLDGLYLGKDREQQ